MSPDDPQAHILLAQALEGEGKHAEAAKELQNSLDLQDSAEIRLFLAHVFLSMNQPEQARLQVQSALNLEPSNKQAVQMMQQIPAGAPAARTTP